MSQTQYAQQVVKVTEWKNGCIKKTATVKTIWVTDTLLFDTREKQNTVAKKYGGDFLGSMSTSTPYDQFTRMVQDNSPDFIRED